MIPTSEFYSLLTSFEGLKLYAYQDSAGVWTIGIGTTVYPDGRHVKVGDKCTKEQANEWARYEAGKKAATISGLLINTLLSPNQFNALLSLTYNIGAGAFAASTLLKRVKTLKPEQPDYKDKIREAFLMWNKITKNGGKVPDKGLTIRRGKEADLFLS